MSLKIIGLTGSMGMGKSTVGKMFEKEGISIYNVDAEIHKLYDVGGAAVEPLRAEFPSAVIKNKVDRPTLSKLVVGNEEAIKRLERIVHPLVGLHRADFLSHAEAAGQFMVVLDVPLIFETGGEANYDKIVVVSAPEDLQKSRVLARDDMTEEKFQAIRARQTPDAVKREKADYIIHTGCPEEETFLQVKSLIETLKKEFAHA